MRAETPAVIERSPGGLGLGLGLGGSGGVKRRPPGPASRRGGEPAQAGPCAPENAQRPRLWAEGTAARTPRRVCAVRMTAEPEDPFARPMLRYILTSAIACPKRLLGFVCSRRDFLGLFFCTLWVML